MTGKKEKRKKLSLLVAFPSLAKEWHPEKNDMFGPGDVFPDDFLHVWWQCHKKHEWIATIVERVEGAGCPVCHSLPRRIRKRLSLAESQPEAAKYWHPVKNGALTPNQFAGASSCKVWWRCEKGHEWYGAIQSVNNRPRCPICYPGKKASLDNNLALKRPELARMWHPTKNGDLLPLNIAPKSTKEIWWQCEKGHDWQEKPSVIYKKLYCPVCFSGKRRERHKLDSAAPALVRLWHPEKNEGIRPADFFSGSLKRVWWKCEKGHEWERAIYYMVNSPVCPLCRQDQRLAEWNLRVQNPELAAQWHPEKNDGLTPEQVAPHANRKVWWLCPKNHEYQATVGNRNRKNGKGRGCPVCAGRKREV